MNIRIPAGAAVLHAASTLDVSVIRREGALLAFRFTSDTLDGTLKELADEDARIADKILATENEAEIAGLTDLKRAVLDIERDVRNHFQVLEMKGAASEEPTVGDAGSHPTATGDAAISNAPQQSSEAVNEEIDNEPSQQEQVPAGRKRR